MMGKKIDLEKYRTIGSVRSGYKTSEKKWVHDGDTSGSFQTSHWDGRLDVVIKPKVVKLNAGVHGREGS